MTMPRKTTPTFASLFSGCGGFDLGLLQAGFQPTIACDIDLLALRVHRHNLQSPTVACDLTLARLPCGDLPRVDVLVAGPPCQGFSTAGHRRLEDPRNALLLTAAKLADVFRPRVAVLENVPGAKSGTHGRYWKRTHEEFKARGYRTSDFLCNTADIGLPQTRKRLILIAWNNPDKDTAPRLPTKSPSSLKDALQNINGAPNHDLEIPPPGLNTLAIAKRIGAGQKLSNSRRGNRSIHTWDIPEVFGQTTAAEKALLSFLILARRRNRRRATGDADPVAFSVIEDRFGAKSRNLLRSLIEKNYIRRDAGDFDLTHTFNGKYRRLDWHEPSPTVHTRFGDPRYFLHPKENRGMSVREAARIQGFPDEFKFLGGRRPNYRLVGNAVPPPLARELGLMIRRSYL